MSPDDFRMPSTYPRNGDLVISWTDLSKPTDILVYRTFLFTDES